MHTARFITIALLAALPLLAGELEQRDERFRMTVEDGNALELKLRVGRDFRDFEAIKAHFSCQGVPSTPDSGLWLERFEVVKPGGIRCQPTKTDSCGFEGVRIPFVCKANELVELDLTPYLPQRQFHQKDSIRFLLFPPDIFVEWFTVEFEYLAPVPEGIRGEPGRDGKDGRDGIGVAGVNGKDGKPGRDGKDCDCTECRRKKDKK